MIGDYLIELIAMFEIQYFILPVFHEVYLKAEIHGVQVSYYDFYCISIPYTTFPPYFYINPAKLQSLSVNKYYSSKTTTSPCFKFSFCSFVFG